ncbi:TetR/AcrR family transcriptional regulator [Cryptosporangium aurantiacum]|uniref:Transcriptional regulator, TetR family n=1 Tax=Cryptosporangium aurantiacum TaxID=134849 RepID=A0A1M7QSD0_9ACTN|nr:TetR/AcrR family transcriptional regulator [Cryptosporangium aurantiacum]SHN34559.1 transcriptional regulator, TetR family [Cryptosporangium aurantiacum]
MIAERRRPKADDGRIARGAATRREILDHAARVASVDGLTGLSLGRLATDLGLSKSAVFAHFSSTERLHLAVVAAAVDVFRARVVEPALAVEPGRARVEALTGGWLTYSEQRAFPGGCFFLHVGAEFDARPGPVRDALSGARRDWLRLLTGTIRDAVRLGEFAADTDAAQLAFEVDAVAAAANSAALLLDDPQAYERARRAIRARLVGAPA